VIERQVGHRYPLTGFASRMPRSLRTASALNSGAGSRPEHPADSNAPARVCRTISQPGLMHRMADENRDEWGTDAGVEALTAHPSKLHPLFTFPGRL
jgi:hypothetical protein